MPPADYTEHPTTRYRLYSTAVNTVLDKAAAKQLLLKSCCMATI
jgi:hypothetical protein